VIVTEGGTSTSLAAKNATSTIPVVFLSSDDPVATGLVANLARPGGNLTGVSMMHAELVPELLQMLLEQIPQARPIGLLKDPTDSLNPEPTARALGVRLQVEQVFTIAEADAAVAKLVQLKADGLVVHCIPGSG
jgi:putative tryptophan/tyrosine transport system substrate-binding protein